MKVGVLIARMQVESPHAGHMFIIDTMLAECDKVLILLGSANRARSIKNPWTYAERVSSIVKAVSKKHNIDKNRFDIYPLNIYPLNDYKYSDSQWIVDVTKTIDIATPNNAEVTLYGYYKEGNEYLKWFPQYKYRNVDSGIKVSGTYLRTLHPELLPKSVQNDLAYFNSEADRFKDYPFPDTLNFNCADAILECCGHILLIKRTVSPGAGTWALPGGFKQKNETFLDCALRELYEETNVRVPYKVIRGSIVSTKLFDDPNRGNGIPRNTLAVHIVIKPEPDGSLPRANAADDAASVKWFQLQYALNKLSLYDDHSDIIQVMTNTTPSMAVYNLSN